MSKSIGEVNERAARGLEASAEEQRLAFIQDAFDGLLALLEEQELALDGVYAEGLVAEATLQLFVLDDDLCLPEGDDIHQHHSFSMVLMDKSGANNYGDTLTVYVPVVDGVFIDEFLDIDGLRVQKPDFIVIKRKDQHGVTTWLHIGTKGVAPFVPAMESGSQARVNDIDDLVLEDEFDVMLKLLSKKVDTKAAMVMELHQAFVNMTAIYQRTVIVKDGTIQIVDVEPGYNPEG